MDCENTELSGIIEDWEKSQNNSHQTIRYTEIALYCRLDEDVGMYAGANKGRLKGCILPPAVKLDLNHFVK